MRFNVEATGKLAGVGVLKSAGPTPEHKMLDRVAVEQRRDCKFTPGADEIGRRTGASVDVQYAWKLA